MPKKVKKVKDKLVDKTLSKKAMTGEVHDAPKLPIRINRLPVATVASQSAVFAEQLTEAVAFIGEQETTVLAQSVAMLAPLGKSLTTYHEGMKTELKKRALAGDAHFSAEGDKKLYIDIGDQTVEVGIRNSYITRPDALKWLKKKKPQLYLELTMPVFVIENEEGVRDAISSLRSITANVVKSRIKAEPVQDVLRLLEASVSEHRVLVEKAVANAVKQGVLTEAELEEHLYETKESSALSVVKRKVATNAEEDED